MATEINMDKIYFQISEVATMLNVSPSLLRYWEAEFPHLRPKTNRRGDRRYRKEDIEQIRVIYTLVKEKGFTLQGAKDIISQTKKQKNQVVLTPTEALKKMRIFLVDLKEALIQAQVLQQEAEGIETEDMEVDNQLATQSDL